MAERMLITVAEDGTISDVVAELEAAGVAVEKVLEAIGVIVASCPDGGTAALATIRGVAGVEPDREVRLPPPDSDVQ